MASQDHKSRPIRARQAAEFGRWRMPEMSAAQRSQLIALACRNTPKTDAKVDPVELVEEPLHAEKLTVAEWEQLREEARQEGIAQGREEGIAEGREIGQKLGYEEGIKQADARIEEQLNEVKKLVDQLREPLKEQENQLHQLLLKLVLQISESVVEAEFVQRSELILKTIREALNLVPPGSGNPTIKMHPEDCALMQSYADLQGWELRENPEAKRGDIQLVAGSCVISSELEQKMLQVAGTLFQHASGKPADESD